MIRKEANFRNNLNPVAVAASLVVVLILRRYGKVIREARLAQLR